MSETVWTAEEIEGFVTRLGAFYAELSETERRILTDMLRDRVQATAEVSGYALAEQVLSADALTDVISQYLLAHPSAAR
jgi:hypothetical protein